MAYFIKSFGNSFENEFFFDSGFTSVFDFENLLTGLDFLTPTTSKIVVAEEGGTVTPIDRFFLGDLDGSNGFSISGVDGWANSNIGDVNGDGIDDFIIGASRADANGIELAGQAYVIFGTAGSFPSNIDITDLDGSNGFAINGINSRDFAGSSVSGLGDVNGDGIDDFIIGAPGVASGSGDSYVVFGTADGHNGSFDLTSIDGSNGFILYGNEENDSSGSSVSAAGDINGDGFADILVGASRANVDGENYGEAYVVYGSARGYYPNLYLHSLDNSEGFSMSGFQESVWLGQSVSSAGDVNGDGIDDILVGAPGATQRNGQPGEVYVVFGSEDGLGNNVDLTTLDGTNGFVITGLQGGGFRGLPDGVGSAVSSAGDVNGDGIDDILIGSDSNGFYVGRAFVIYGSTTGYNGNFNITRDPNDSQTILLNGRADGSHGFVLTTDLERSFTGSSVSNLGDINGDGYDDFIVSSNGARPTGNVEAGAEYVVFGTDTGYNGSLDLTALDGRDGFVISGDENGGTSGNYVSGAGDVNNDGFADILVSMPSAHESYIIFGSAEFGRTVTTLEAGNHAYSVTGGSEVVYAGGGDDIIDGLGGSDYLYGEGGHDDMFGGDGNDMLDGGFGDDILNGGYGDDTLIGGEGSDILIGAEGEDTLNGGTGNDYITGGIGDDHLRGGEGEDIFVIMAGAGNDVIYDFEVGIDWIEFGDGVYNFDQLSFIQVGNDVQIKTTNGVTTLIDINISDISEYDFIFRTSTADSGAGDSGGNSLPKPVVSDVSPEIELPNTMDDTVIAALLEIDAPYAHSTEALEFNAADMMLPWLLNDFEQIV